MKLQLNRDYNLSEGNPFDVDGMNARMKQIVAFRDDALSITEDWDASICSILDFQLGDGSFALAENWCDMPFEERYYYVYRPSYACCQALMKALACILVGGPHAAGGPDQHAQANLAGRIERALASGLSFCCTRNLEGDGYDGIKHTIQDLLDFKHAYITSIASTHRHLCPEFFDLVDKILERMQIRVAMLDVFDAFGGNHLIQMMELLEEFDMCPPVNVFVYGTLMAGMRNARLIEQSPYRGQARLDGYTMFDLGSYPGIVASERVEHRESTVLGEIRLVDLETLKALNELEGEGSLYRATRVMLRRSGFDLPALAYVYLHDIDPQSEIPLVMQPYNRYINERGNLVWYVCYGSNIKFERFMTYIQGGRCRYNLCTYSGCSNPAAPLDSMPFDLPYSVYFGNESPSRIDSGVAFLDVSEPGHAYGRAYLITHEQFEQLHASEGKSAAWYPDVIELGQVGGIPAMTFTNKSRREANAPDCNYEEVFVDGLLETYPHMSEQEAYAYVQGCYLK